MLLEARDYFFNLGFYISFFFFNSFLYCLLLACLELCSQIGAFPFALVLSAGTPDSIYLWIHAVCAPHLFFFFSIIVVISLFLSPATWEYFLSLSPYD